MKPAPFDYHAPTTVAEAVALLADHGDEAKVLAGGQSLVPAMNFRLARPAVLVDINRLRELEGARVVDGALEIGALTRHAAFERPLAPGPLGTLLPRVARAIAHWPIRVRGSFGGSLAHADPAAEWCAVALALDAQITAVGPSGERRLAAREFFKTMFTTALGVDELLVRVRLPLLDRSWRLGFAEFSRRAGDFALALAVVAARLDDDRVSEVRIALGGVADRPVRAAGAERALIGDRPSEEAIAGASEIAVCGVTPMDDIHAPATYRAHLARVMTRRALTMALA